MGYVSNLGEVASDMFGAIPTKIRGKAIKNGRKAYLYAMNREMSAEEAKQVSMAAYKATKYGIYGALGVGAVGGVYGLVDEDHTLIGGTASGAGLGALGGATVGAIAAGIAKSTR